MRQERGYMPPVWPYAAEKDIDFMEAYNNICVNSERGLPIKTRELVAIALTAVRSMEEGSYQHMKKALRYGATKQDIFNTLKVSFMYGGAPTLVTGLQALMRIEEEGKKTVG